MNVLVFLFTILSIYSIYFLLSQSSILNFPRKWLMEKSPFFYKLFSCPYCLGTHSGWIAYLVFTPFINYSLVTFILWVLAAGPLVLIINGLVNDLYRE